MILPALLEELRKRDVEIWADGDVLRCNAPVGALTTSLREELRQRRGVLVEFLRSAETLAQQQRAVVPLQPRGARVPIFGVPGHNGDVFCYRALARELGDEQPFYGLQPPGVDGHSEPLERIGELAEFFADQIRAFRPDGPCVIAGYCAGGATAFELARRLVDGGTAVSYVALFASPYPSAFRVLPQFRQRLSNQVARIREHITVLASLSPGGVREYVAAKLAARRLARTNAEPSAPDAVMALRAKVENATVAALRRYIPGPFAGHVAFFLPNRQFRRPGNAFLRWKGVARQTDEYWGPDGCEADHMLLEPNVSAIGELVRLCHNKHASATVEEPSLT